MSSRDFAAYYSSWAKQLHLLIHKLDESDYQFANRSSALLPPHSETESFIHVFERNGLRLPAALKEFYRRFGGINLSGRYADWPETAYPDPLWVDPLELIVEELETEFLASQEQKKWHQEVYGGFYFVIAPDYYHKEGVSGGQPYGIVLPTVDDDPLLEGLPWQFRLTEYLDFAVSSNGFPGLEVLK